jgi:hypothetical protein
VPEIIKDQHRQVDELLTRAAEEGADAEATAGRVPEEGPDHLSRHDLYEKAKDQQIPGRSKMSRDQLAEALGES